MMRSTVPVILTILIAASTAGADEKLIWQIGQTDHDFRDLANADDPMSYRKAFPDDVAFVVGKSDPRKDFSAIHPGPVDSWVSRHPQEHPFKITFNLDEPPSGKYELRIDLVDTDNRLPPVYRVTVNGKSAEIVLEPGFGPLSLLHPNKGKARSLRFFVEGHQLKQGANEIELRSIKGFWLLYDAVSLRKLDEQISPQIQVAARSSIYFIEKAGRLKQEFTISASGLPSDTPAKVEVSSEGNPLETLILSRPSLGSISSPLYIDATDQPRKLTITVSAGRQSSTTTIAQQPHRKWRLYVAPSTHTDIGYTHVQDEVIKRHNYNTDLALELFEQFPEYDWNLESSWAAQMWLRDRLPYRHEKLYEAARQRRLGIEAGYLNMLTGLCSEEELIRNLYYTARLHRQYGIPFKSYTLTDAPSHVWTLPSILAGAGLRYLSIGINTIRAPLLKQNIHHKSPFWWEGPDGQRVLTWFAAGYAQAGLIGLRQDFNAMKVMIESHLYWYDQRGEDYPYDAIFLHGAYGDNAAIRRELVEALAEYNKHYAYPKVILGANDDFLEYIEKNFADKIPTVRGCGGSWWEDGAASTALETGINRVTHQDVIAAETVWAAATGNAQPSDSSRDKFNGVWDNILLFDEHTWGAYNSISEPERDFVHRQWAVKASYATKAANTTARLLEEGLDQLAAKVNAPDGSILVFNPSGQPRSGMVHADIPNDQGLVDSDGSYLDQQVAAQSQLKNAVVAFWAKDVPAVGYKTYKLQPQALSSRIPIPSAKFHDKVLENKFYRVEFDPVTGGVVSLIDKTLNQELIDQDSKYKLGQVIYAKGGAEEKGKTQWTCPDPKGIEFLSPKAATIKKGMHGPVCSSAKTIARLPMLSNIEMEVVLYEHEQRVDFVYRLIKKMTYDKEALYIAFPIAGNNPQFRYEIGGGSVRPNKDQLPGGCRDWFSVQRWVTVNTDDAAVAWSAVDTPLITLCDMNPGKWLDELEITNGTIFAYTMNNYWFTNYKAGQDGKFTFRYSLTSDKAIDPAAASLFGESVHAPMRAVRLRAGREQKNLPPSKSFCRVEPENVTLTTVKHAEDGQGLIVRIRETAGKDTDTKITVGFEGITKASRCDHVERNQGPMPLKNGKITLNLKSNTIATIRLE